MASKPKTKKTTARRKKGAAAAEPENPPAAKMTQKASQIGVNDLKNLVRHCASWKKQGSEITGQIGKAVSAAAENKNLDKTAFAMVRRLKEMSDQKRATTLACFDYYRDVLDLDITPQGDLSLARQEAGETEGGPNRDAGDDGEGDVRPPHLRSVKDGGTRVDTVADLKRQAGADA